MRLKCLLLCLLLSSPALSANEMVVYRCTDASGELTLQNMPCPSDTTQERRVMQPVNSVPMGTSNTMPRPAAPAPAPAPATGPAPAPTPAAMPYDEATASDQAAAAVVDDAPASPSTAVPLLPPPNLFQCTTHDKNTYITESAEPQSRCVALRTVGLDGNPDTGAGQACEVIRDTCARVADGNLCDAWKKRLGETEVAWRFARPANAQANEAEHVRVRRILAETSCSAEAGG